MRLFTTLACLILFLGLDAQIITDRPDQTESANTVGKRNLQIETGILMSFEELVNDNSIRQIVLPTTLFRFGLTDWMELRLVSQFEMNRYLDRNDQGMSDLEIGTKISFPTKEGSGTEIAFLTHLVAPIGSNEVSGGTFGTINKLSIAHELSEHVGLGYNVGYDYFTEEYHQATYSLALGVGVNDRVGVYIEPYGALVNFENFVINADAGFTYLVNPDFQLDFSFGTGLNRRMNYVSVGLSWITRRKDN